MLRSFIAIELPSEVQSAIAHATAGLQKALPKPLVRWVARENVHLTLKFLGEVSPVNVERLAEALKMEAAQHDAFTFDIGELGAFPTARRARVIWIGIQAPAGMQLLQHGVEAVASRLGYPAEERTFSPHLTIGRVSQNVSTTDLARIRETLESIHVGTLGTVVVNAIHIFKSDLKPTGSVYTQLYSLPLKT